MPRAKRNAQLLPRLFRKALQSADPDAAADRLIEKYGAWAILDVISDLGAVDDESVIERILAKLVGAPVKKNPMGKPAAEYTIVQLGNGKKTHLYSPKKGTLCQSGKNAGKHSSAVKNSGARPEIYKSSAAYVTCERCQKLASINEKKNQNGSLLPDWMER